jgi:hypothetical protein
MPTLLMKQRTSEVECAYRSLHQFTALILTILGTFSLKESILLRIFLIQVLLIMASTSATFSHAEIRLQGYAFFQKKAIHA